MSEKKSYHRNASFHLRIDETLLATLRDKAKRSDVPLNQYIADILARTSDDTTAYHQRMASKHAYISHALLNVLATRLLPQDVRRDVMRTIGEQADKLFGANPPIPDEVARNLAPNDPDYVTDLFLMFERHAENHWKITPE